MGFLAQTVPLSLFSHARPEKHLHTSKAVPQPPTPYIVKVLHLTPAHKRKKIARFFAVMQPAQLFRFCPTYF